MKFQKRKTATIVIISSLVRKLSAICAMLLLLPAISATLTEVSSAHQQLLRTVGDLVNIDSTADKPFQLDAGFRAQMNFPQNGHFSWKWIAKDLWSEEITMGSYRQLNIRKGDTLYISRNAPFTPLRIAELQDLLHVFSVEAHNWEIQKIKHQVQSGIETQCLELRIARPSRGEWNPKRELCINQATKEVLTDEAKDDQEYRRKEFRDYQRFRAHSYPTQLKLLETAG